MEDKAAILVGGGGNCIAMLDLLEGTCYAIRGVLDTRRPPVTEHYGVAYLGCDDNARALRAEGVEFAIVTMAAPLSSRADVVARYQALGFVVPAIASPEALVSSRAVLKEGATIYPGANVGSGATIGANAIINANAVVTHGVVVGECSHIAPNATLLGDVSVGRCTLIGAGSVVLPGVSIGSNCSVGAGSVVLSDIPDGEVFVGNPAHKIR